MTKSEPARVLDAVLRSIGKKHQHRWGSSDASRATKLVNVRGWVVPNRIDVEYPGVDGQPTLSMTLEVIAGIPQCRELRLTSHPGGRSVRPKDLSAIQLNDWVNDEFAGFAIEVSEDGRTGEKLHGGPAARGQAARSAAAFQRSRRQGEKRTMTRERIKEAADIYAAHFDNKPIEAVANHFGVSDRQASNYVARAREDEYGFLPPIENRGSKGPNPSQWRENSRGK